jgi:membrane-bound lytic murein transglycosylase D
MMPPTNEPRLGATSDRSLVAGSLRPGRRGAVWPWALSAALLAVAGCATQTPHEVRQFEPIPSVSVGEQELAPVSTRPVTEILREADETFRQATQAQQRGDRAAANAHFQKTLELLVAAELDPAIFYSLRKEFGGLLESAGQEAKVPARLPSTALTESLKPGEGISELQIPFPIPERVLREIEELQQTYPKNFQSGLDRSQKYMPYIREEFAKAGLPSELAWLAMVESLFTPRIVSRAGAGGMWQFMRFTAQRYHLRIDSYVDERYNWQSSTRAAIGYLRDLHKFFAGAWPLAVSAYNMGEGGMLRAVEANGGERDFWTLVETPPAANRMATETKKYYPRLLAYIIVGNNPERYGFRTNPQPPESIMRVPVNGMYPLDTLDAAMGYAPGTLASLNPDLLREVTPATGDYGLAIPADAQERFAVALQQVSAQSVDPGSHQVRRGETLGDIAEQYGISERELMRVNHLRSSRQLKYGQTLRIPGSASGMGGPETQVAAKAPEERRDAPDSEYMVKRGDTLFNIARAHQVEAEDLARWNGLDRRARLQAGQKLRLRGPAVVVAQAPGESGQAPTEPAREAKYYTVRKGDFPARIAQRYGISLDNLLKWNNLTKKSTIRVGQRLQVSVPSGDMVKVAARNSQAEVSPATAETESITHKVAKGETAGAIATKYGVPLKDVLSWNNLTAKSVLRVGQNLTIKQPGKAPVEMAQAPDAPEKDPVAVEAAPELTHKVAKGETAGAIASKYGVPLKDVLSWNKLTAKSVLQVGQTLVIRQPAVKVAKTADAPKEEPVTAETGPGLTHKVAPGETAGAIATKYRVRLKDLLAWNNLTEKSVLKVGQELTLGQSTTASAPAAPQKEAKAPAVSEKVAAAAQAPAAGAATATHKVAPGETAGAIATQYRVRLKDLLAWNGMTEKSVLKIGQNLTLHPAEQKTAAVEKAPESSAGKEAPKTGPSEDSEAGERIVHTVSKGQNPTVIARRYGVKVNDLMKWNRWPTEFVLKVGEEVVVYKKR